MGELHGFRLPAPVVWAGSLALAAVAIGLFTELVTADSPPWWGITGFGVAAVAAVGLPGWHAALGIRERRDEQRKRRAKVLQPFTAPIVGSSGHSVVSVLNPLAGLSPFVGRSREVAELVTWCSAAEGEGIRIVEGPSGVGKTPVGDGGWRRQIGAARGVSRRDGPVVWRHRAGSTR